MNCQSYAARYGEAIGPKGGSERRTERLGVLEPGEPTKPRESQSNAYFIGGRLNITKQGVGSGYHDMNYNEPGCNGRHQKKWAIYI
jgi:hypothetical protein